jgi:hypothetical protein
MWHFINFSLPFLALFHYLSQILWQYNGLLECSTVMKVLYSYEYLQCCEDGTNL